MKWISVSEKLPELTIHENEPFIGEWDNSEPVLVYHSDDKWECKYLVAQYTNGFADVGEPILYGWVDVNDGEEVKGVLAWMPLPQPYTADRKDENSSEKPNNSTSSKMEQVDEPIDRDDLGNCNICKYVGLEHRCNQCVNGSMFCKVEDEPQTSGIPYEIETSSVCKDEPQTEREGE